METILRKDKTLRTSEQNCVAMILGKELFTNELAKGAYFLLEDWALRWDEIMAKTFGEKPDIIQEIFQVDRKYLLAIRTPCSGDFKSEAEYAGKIVGVPVKWIDVSLDNLEMVLEKVIERKIKELECLI